MQNLEKYKNLIEDLKESREKKDGAREDRILDEMDAVWLLLTEKEVHIVNCIIQESLCPSCGGTIELTGTVYSCIKCDWWEYSSS